VLGVSAMNEWWLFVGGSTWKIGRWKVEGGRLEGGRLEGGKVEGGRWKVEGFRAGLHSSWSVGGLRIFFEKGLV